jgi:hypothetical protein
MDLKELKALLKLLRQNGVLTYKSTTLELNLAPESHLLPVEKVVEVQEVEVDPDDPYRHFPVGELTAEQLMYYSAGGDPASDPENN